MNLNKQQHEYTALCLSQTENKSSEELFESLIEELKPLIYKKIRYISHNKYDIEDMYQEIVIKFYRALHKFNHQQGVPIEHYIYFLIRSVKYDYLRKVRANYKRQPLLVNECIVEYNATLALNDIERSIIRKELTLAFKRSEVKLSRMERRIIRLLLNDYKPKEIAMVLNLESKVVYNAIQRSKCKLKRSFE